MHTPCDNLAYQFVKSLLEREKPKRIKDVLDVLLTVPEYEDAARRQNPPKIFIGSPQAKVSCLHIEFTGGTEGPQDVYDKLSAQGIDTIVAMHQSEEHYKKCKKANINVIVASHIASDAIGVNLMLDHLQARSRFEIHQCSGFLRVSRQKKTRR